MMGERFDINTEMGLPQNNRFCNSPFFIMEPIGILGMYCVAGFLAEEIKIIRVQSYIIGCLL